jgi:hypothetical protein
MTIKTVYVPIFKNLTIIKGLEFDITREVVKEIEKITPYKVVSDPAHADTELDGIVVSRNKININIDPLNEVREAQLTLTATVIWRDLRPGHQGEFLSAPRKPGEPAVPPPGAPLPPPVVLTSLATFIPELGESITTGTQKNVRELAVQIVSMMEKPW